MLDLPNFCWVMLAIIFKANVTMSFSLCVNKSVTTLPNPIDKVICCMSGTLVIVAIIPIAPICNFNNRHELKYVKVQFNNKFTER